MLGMRRESLIFQLLLCVKFDNLRNLPQADITLDGLIVHITFLYGTCHYGVSWSPGKTFDFFQIYQLSKIFVAIFMKFSQMKIIMIYQYSYEILKCNITTLRMVKFSVHERFLTCLTNFQVYRAKTSIFKIRSALA